VAAENGLTKTAAASVVETLLTTVTKTLKK
jgi:nucleoid DNA-binding protein